MVLVFFTSFMGVWPIDYSTGGSENQNVLDKQKIDSTYEVLNGKKGSAKNWARGHLCYLLVKTFGTLCPYSEDLSEAEFKSNGLDFRQRKLQVRIISILCQSYCSLLLPSSTV